MTGIIESGSIRRRLVLQLLCIAALLSVLLYFLVRTFAEQAAEDTQDNILAASAISIADELRSERGEVLLDLPYSALSMLGAISQDRVFYRVARADVTLTGYDDLPLPQAMPAPGEPVFFTREYRGEPVRIAAVARTITVEGAPIDITVVVAQTRLALEAVSDQVTTTAAALGIGFFAFAGALSIFAAQSALRPLSRIAQSVGRRGPHDLRPVPLEAPSELAPLLDSLNGFMDRLRVSLSRTEDFIAEAAHRVRTPLATVRAQAEIALRRVERPENKSALRKVIRAVDESSRSAGQLLDYAMVAFRTEQLEDAEIDLKELVDEVVRRLGPTAELKDIHLDVVPAGPSRPLRGDPILLHNALGNVVDNAIKYSPSDSRIRIETGATADGVFLAVRDEGSGFGDGDIAALKDRFHRGENAASVVGSGLGLTIADDVVSAHGGRLELSGNGEGKGACVTLYFPQS